MPIAHSQQICRRYDNDNLLADQLAVNDKAAHEMRFEMNHGHANSYRKWAISCHNRSSLSFLVISLLVLIAYSSLQQIGFVSRIILSRAEDHDGTLKRRNDFFSDETNTMVDAGATKKTSAIVDAGPNSSFARTVFLVPNRPLSQAQSSVEEAIGRKVLNDSNRNPLQNCSVTVQYRLFIPQTG